MADGTALAVPFRRLSSVEVDTAGKIAVNDRSNLLDLVLRLIHLLCPSRSWRRRGEKWNSLDMCRARAIVLVRIVRPQTTLIVG